MSLIGKPIKSRITGMKGAIVDVDRKNLIISFSIGGVKVPLSRYSDLLEMSEQTKQEVEEYILSLKKPVKKTANPE